jgi:hypothetical protein
VSNSTTLAIARADSSDPHQAADRTALLAIIAAAGLKRGAVRITWDGPRDKRGGNPALRRDAACGCGDARLDPEAGTAIFSHKRLI